MEVGRKLLLAGLVALGGLTECGCSSGNNGGVTDRGSGAQVVGDRDRAQLDSVTAAGAARTDNGVSGGPSGAGSRSAAGGAPAAGSGGSGNTGAAVGTGATLDNGQANTPNPPGNSNSPNRP